MHQGKLIVQVEAGLLRANDNVPDDSVPPDNSRKEVQTIPVRESWVFFFV